MKCYICGGDMKQTVKDVEGKWKGRTVIFKGLTPWVCDTCGEEAFEPADVDLMQGLIRGTDEEKPAPEILNIEEVADLLRVSTQTVYNLARNGKLPATKIGREWRFSRDKIKDLLEFKTSKEEAAASQCMGIGARNPNQSIQSRV